MPRAFRPRRMRQRRNVMIFKPSFAAASWSRRVDLYASRRRRSSWGVSRPPGDAFDLPGGRFNEIV